jgi:hypothetical protein
MTFGIGFALNDRAALILSYQQTHVFTAYANGQAITGSPIPLGHLISASAIRSRSRRGSITARGSVQILSMNVTPDDRNAGH